MSSRDLPGHLLLYTATYHKGEDERRTWTRVQRSIRQAEEEDRTTKRKPQTLVFTSPMGINIKNSGQKTPERCISARNAVVLCLVFLRSFLVLPLVIRPVHPREFLFVVL